MAHNEVTAARWFSSLYWRIGVSFVLFLLVVLAAQSLIVRYQFARSGPFRPYPNEVATAIAAEVGAVLAADRSAVLEPLLQRYRDAHPAIYLVLTDGRIVSSTRDPLPIGIRRTVEDALSGVHREGAAGERFAGPVVTAPIHIGGRLQGLVVLPPPERGGAIGDLGRVVSLPGTLLLLVATMLAVFVIFTPARRRLAALEAAAVRMGGGDLTARAPQIGSDEVSRVAAAFNRMGEQLAARDAALRRSDHLRRQMLADVSHELKTPLTAMRGYLETLRMADTNLDAADRARYLETVERETQRLERIVRDLLDLARLENRLGELQPRPFAIGRLFDHVIRRYERLAQEAHISLRAEVADEADQIVADPDRLEQVVDNLTANALRHAPAGGAVTLRAEARGDAIVLSVADSGAGIRPEDLPFVFERFYKGDKARASGGSGLGLSIVKAIVERHGGTIDVASEPGRTEFTVVLPDAGLAEREYEDQSTSTNLYPMPQAVRISSGSLASRSIFFRIRLTTVSTVRSVT